MADADEAQDEDDEAILVAHMAGDEEDDNASLLKQSMVVVQLFGETGETTEESSTSIHFYAMIRSLKRDKILLPEVAASFLTLAIQIALLHGFIYAYFIGPSLKSWNSWHHTLHFTEEEGGTPAMIAALVGVACSPLILLVKMQKANEFSQTPLFRATMRTMIKSQPPQPHVYMAWVLNYVLRAYWVIPYTAVTNTVLAVSEQKIRSIMVMVLVVVFLLDLDDFVFLTFFATYNRRGGLQLDSDSCVRAGKETMHACVRVKLKTIIALTLGQVAMILTLKVHPWISFLWSLPVYGMTLLVLQKSEFPKTERSWYVTHLTSKAGLPWVVAKGVALVGTNEVLALLVPLWVYCMRCVITPYCGDGSRYFATLPYEPAWPWREGPIGVPPGGLGGYGAGGGVDE